MNNAMQFVNRCVKDLQVGESGYVVPWAIQFVQPEPLQPEWWNLWGWLLPEPPKGFFEIKSNYTVHADCFGTSHVRITRTGSRLEFEVTKPEYTQFHKTDSTFGSGCSLIYPKEESK